MGFDRPLGTGRSVGRPSQEGSLTVDKKQEAGE